MADLLKRCAVERRSWLRDQATDIRTTRWQPLRGLQRWCEDPRKGWVPLGTGETSADLVPLFHAAMEALGEEVPKPDTWGTFIVENGVVRHTSGSGQIAAALTGTQPANGAPAKRDGLFGR